MLRTVAEGLSIKVEPATQVRYRDTALCDTRAILRSRPLVTIVAAAAVAASILVALTTELPVFLKALLAAVAAGAGALVVLFPVVFLATLAVAPHRQRNEARSQAQHSNTYLAHYRFRLALFRELDFFYLYVIGQAGNGPSADSLGRLRRTLIDSEQLLTQHGEPAVAKQLADLRSRLASIGETPNTAQFKDVADEIVQFFATLVSIRGPLFAQTPEIPRKQ